MQLPETDPMPDHQILLQLVIMGDPTWMCLFKPDLSDRSTVKGNLRVKILIEDIEELSVEKREPQRLNMAFRLKD